MKRYISLGLCMLFALTLSAQKVLIVHKTDGTKIEIPVEENPTFYTSGKAVVNEDDYTRVLETRVEMPNVYPESPIIYVTDLFSRQAELQGGGICYSMSPGVSVDNGTCISWTGDFMLRPDTMEYGFTAEYNTAYYIRSYVLFMDEYYYSKEVCVNVGNPVMRWYRKMINPKFVENKACVIPTEEAWANFLAQMKRHTHLLGLASNDAWLISLWDSYLTEDKMAQLIPSSQQYDCNDGVLYALDEVSDDFVDFVIDYCASEMTLSGYSELDETDAAKVTLSHMQCSAEWNVPGNEYWVYEPVRPTGPISATLPFTLPVLAGYNYAIEITLAPDTERNDTLPTQFRVKLEAPIKSGAVKTTTLARDLVTNVDQCTIVTFESVTIEGFGAASLMLESTASSTEVKNGVYSRTLRIAQVKISPLGPASKE